MATSSKGEGCSEDARKLRPYHFMCASMATGSIDTYRLIEVVDKQAPRVKTRGEEKVIKLLRGELEQPSIDLLHFPVHRESRMGVSAGQRTACRSLDRPCDWWADGARAGRAGLTSKHDCCYLVENGRLRITVVWASRT